MEDFCCGIYYIGWEWMHGMVGGYRYPSFSSPSTYLPAGHSEGKSTTEKVSFVLFIQLVRNNLRLLSPEWQKKVLSRRSISFGSVSVLELETGGEKARLGPIGVSTDREGERKERYIDYETVPEGHLLIISLVFVSFLWMSE